MRRAIVMIVAVLLLFAGLILGQNATDLFQQALDLEQGKGDLAGAMQIYQRIVVEFHADKSVAAHALYRLAHCQELIGQAQARSSYEQLLGEYPDQTAAVDSARIRLAAMSAAETASRNPGIFSAPMDPRTGMVRGPVNRLTLGSLGADRFPTWSPDGKSIAFKRTLAPTGQPPIVTIVYGLETGLENRIGNHEAVPSTAAANNLQAVIQTLVEPARAANPQPSTNALQAAQGIGRGRGGARGNAGPSIWFPDGNGLASIRGNVIYRDRLDGSSEMLVNVDPGGREVALSPDGKTLFELVLTRNSAFLSSTVTTFDVATGERKRAFNLPSGSAAADDVRGRGSYLSLNSDGSMLAIVRWKGERQPLIGRWGIDGTGYAESAVGSGLIQRITWAKDNRDILFARSEDGVKWQILRLAGDGAPPAPTGLEVTDLTFFDLSPDGSRIVFDGMDPKILSPAAVKPAR